MKKPLKYKNKITTVDGLTFHSKGEANRWKELKLLEKAGEVKNLKRQVAFHLVFGGVDLKTKYIADFIYTTKSGHKVMEDFKGVETRLFKLKWAILKAMFPDVVFVISGKNNGKRNNRDVGKVKRRDKKKV